MRHNHSMSSTATEAPASEHKRPGRPSKQNPQTEFEQLFCILVKRAQTTLAELARKLGINSKTLYNFRDGKIKQLESFHIDDLLDLLGLEVNDVDRRTFLKIMGDLGISSIAARRVLKLAFIPKILPTLNFPKLDIDVYASAILGWQRAFLHGEDAFTVLTEVTNIQERLADYSAEDKKIAKVRIHAGMLLANVQETTASWRDERPRVAIKTYNVLERQVFRKIGPEQFPEEYATLLARRAILYRERGSAYLADSQRQFLVLEKYLGRVQANRLHAAYRVQKMHLFAVQGDKTAWESERASVAQWVRGQTEDREAIQGTFDYILGVGHKRFMWHRRNEEGSAERIADAKAACQYLGDLRQHAAIGALATKILNLYDHIAEDRAQLELAAAELDAFVWVKPEEAVERAEKLLPEARQKYPSIVHKLTDTIDLGMILHKTRKSRWRFRK